MCQDFWDFIYKVDLFNGIFYYFSPSCEIVGKWLIPVKQLL